MSADEGEILPTVFLEHQQDKNLDEINAKLDDTGFWKASRSSAGT
jgi:DNA-binding LytR/AlgR family response regulator